LFFLQNKINQKHRKLKKMNSSKLYCGIDISATTIDICVQSPSGDFVWHKLSNNSVGFKSLQKICGHGYHYVMESTGAFHLPLCFFLHEKKCSYSVVNALQIKRYIQMHLERNKTDKKDAKHICMYGIERNPEQYKMPCVQYFECKTLNNAIETLTQEIVSFSNKLYALKQLKIDNKLVQKTYVTLIKEMRIALKKLEEELLEKLQQWQPELVERVSSVKGIGKRATAILIVFTEGFKHTESYQQLISYAGLSPKEYSSGKSIRGKVRISKIGGKQLRHTLYMCALNAKANNSACKALYDRLVLKGKNKKLAIIAVCNKLLKQVFGVVKTGVLYQDNFCKKVA
jgi:transposase